MCLSIPEAMITATSRFSTLRRSFSDVFDGAKRMRVVTYCDSPEFILDLFEDLDDLDFLEVIVGDVSDHRERLIDKPDLADRLEQLRSEGKLVIYLCENKEVHSKLYLIEYNDSVLEEADEDGDEDQMTLGGEAPVETEPEDTDDGTPAKVIVGSPNLSRKPMVESDEHGRRLRYEDGQ